MICIDPGLRGCGLAYFDEVTGGLIGGYYIKGCNEAQVGLLAASSMALEIFHFAEDYFQRGPAIIECPRIYPIERQKGDQNDLISLACVAGAVAAVLRRLKFEIEMVYPRTWKGQVPKQIMTARIKSKLSEEELWAVKSVGALDHNTFDAVGIGLWKLGRL